MCPHAVALDVEQLVNVCRIMRDELNRLPLCPNIILFLFFSLILCVLIGSKRLINLPNHVYVLV